MTRCAVTRYRGFVLHWYRRGDGSLGARTEGPTGAGYFIGSSLPPNHALKAWRDYVDYEHEKLRRALDHA